MRCYNAVEAPLAPLPRGAFDAFVQRRKFRAEPVVARREADVAARSLDLAQLLHHHRLVFTGFLVPAESGDYRPGIAGFNGAMKLDGKPFVDLTKASWNSLPTMKRLRFEARRRYAIEIVSEAYGLASSLF